MKFTYLIYPTILLIGIGITAMIGRRWPDRLINNEGNFNYQLTGLIIAIWPLSLLLLLAWILTYPARKLTEKYRTKNVNN